MTGSFTPSGQAWVLAQGAVSRAGRVVPTGWGSLYPALPAASRYWPFQGIETGIYLLLAAALIAVTFTVVRRRDA